ncbi:MAG: pantoate--beta-alanine ligase [Marinilabiliaceae bacterium]|nr:pantoate--beta-alanine ligase [Marinilabiliaceae bacterium]
MEVKNTIKDLKASVALARQNGSRIGLVPTMGALHQGHLSLVKRACSECDFVVVSIFVNPTQFNNAEDLKTYPRTLEEDLRLLSENANVDVVFAPSVEEIYPQPDTRQFELGKLAEVMEGRYRPGHFNGVAQIVSKLFMFVEPDKAFFGEKDFQQLAIIRQLVKNLNFSIEIVGCPIVRYMDGLAVSSRNTLLTEEQRAIAPIIQATLRRSVEEMQYKMKPSEVVDWVTNTLNKIQPLQMEYYSIVDGITLQPVNSWEESDYVVGCITCYCGKVRLIDNITYKKSI